jgi:hypothetical protein
VVGVGSADGVVVVVVEVVELVVVEVVELVVVEVVELVEVVVVGSVEVVVDGGDVAGGADAATVLRLPTVTNIIAPRVFRANEGRNGWRRR